MENGVSTQNVTQILNKQLLQNAGGDINIADWYTRSAVEGALNRMPKVEVHMIRRGQGDVNKTSNWAEAHHRFVMQLQVCIGDDADLSKFIDSNGNVLDCFNKDKLDPISFKGTACCHVGDRRDCCACCMM